MYLIRIMQSYSECENVKNIAPFYSVFQSPECVHRVLAQSARRRHRGTAEAPCRSRQSMRWTMRLGAPGAGEFLWFVFVYTSYSRMLG